LQKISNRLTPGIFKEKFEPIFDKYIHVIPFYNTTTSQLFFAVDANGNKVVLKILGNIEEANNELNALEDLNGRRHIVKLLSWVEFKELNMMLFVLKYHEPISFKPRNSLDIARYAYQVLEALYYLHCNCVVHADIKPENIIVDHERNITLIDFGLSVDRTFFSEVCSVRGTRHYMAHEVIRAEPISSAVDMWSLGIIITEMVLSHSLPDSSLGNPEIPEMWNALLKKTVCIYNNNIKMIHLCLLYGIFANLCYKPTQKTG